MSESTPTPWKLVPQSDGSAMLCREFETGKQMNPKGLRIIAHVLARGNSLREDEANAALIVEAVNSFASLQAENERLKAALETIAASFHGNNPSMAYADAPREDYLAHVLFEARKFARAALGSNGSG